MKQAKLLDVAHTPGGIVAFTVRTPEISFMGSYSKVIYANLGLFVDTQCITGPLNSSPTDYFSSPTSGSSIVTMCLMGQTGPMCTGLLSVESVANKGEIDGWIERVKMYQNTPGSLPVEAAWTCSSSRVWYGRVPGFKHRGEGTMTFVATKPLDPYERIFSLAKYVLVGETEIGWFQLRGRSWQAAEDRFLVSSGLRDYLGRLVNNKDRNVPAFLTPGILAVKVNTQNDVETRSVVLLPSPSVYIKLTDNSAEAAEAWVLDTMRQLWFKIVADTERAHGVSDYRPSRNILTKLAFATTGWAVGAGIYAYPDVVLNTFGRLGMTFLESKNQEATAAGSTAAL